MMKFEGTTIVAVRKDGKCAIAGDGQVTFGESAIMKHTAKKVRRLYHDRVVVGFAGTVADAFSLCGCSGFSCSFELLDSPLPPCE